MPRPTSSKNIFVLTKYSRAVYRQQDGLHATQETKGDCDWRHHTQPSLRLLLETQKSAQGAPEQLRLRIVWTVQKGYAGTGTNKPPQQDNVIFEDVDLLVVRKHIHPFPIQGLPLKAVFRDSMVGIRFLPPQAKSSSLSEYRRFQITFQSNSDSAALIEAIRDVCPCKQGPISNPGPSAHLSRSAFDNLGRPEPAQSTEHLQASLPTQSQSQMFLTPPGNRLGPNVTQYLDEAAFPAPSSQSNSLSDLPIEFAVPIHQFRYDNSGHSFGSRSYVDHTTAPARYQSLAPQASHMDLSSSPCPSSPFRPQVLHRPDARSQVHPHQLSSLSNGINSTMRNSEVISESDPIASSRPVAMAMPTPPPSSQGLDLHSSNTSAISANGSSRAPLSLPVQNADDDAISEKTTKQPLLESLYNACRMDHLPRDDLEQLVAHVVREEGFAELLQKIDTLWELKAIINL